MLGASLAKAQQQSASIAQFHFPLYLFSIEEMLDGNVLRVHHLPRDNSPRKKNRNASEGSVFLVTRCSLISGSSEKGCLQASHTFEPFCFPKYFHYKFKTVASRLFLAFKELVEIFVLDNVSYLWANENTFFQFCLT